MDRREFLRKAVIACSAFGLAAAGVILAFLYPANKGQRRQQFVYLMEEDDLPRRGVRMVTFSVRSEEQDIVTVNRVYIVGGGQGLTAFSPVCTHLGCFVNWDSNKKAFLCPCHGGKFNIDGDVIAGPPPAPLMKLPLLIEKGKVFVGVKI
jgi:cytochrome b6-f complex iron-sulfur subunit